MRAHTETTQDGQTRRGRCPSPNVAYARAPNAGAFSRYASRAGGAPPGHPAYLGRRQALDAAGGRRLTSLLPLPLVLGRAIRARCPPCAMVTRRRRERCLAAVVSWRVVGLLRRLRHPSRASGFPTPMKTGPRAAQSTSPMLLAARGCPTKQQTTPATPPTPGPVRRHGARYRGPSPPACVGAGVPARLFATARAATRIRSAAPIPPPLSARPSADGTARAPPSARSRAV